MKSTRITNMLTLIVCAVVLCAMCITLFACGAEVVTPSNSGSGVKNENLQELQVLKSELRLTQEQTMSKIKAEYLLENNGYKDDDEIVIMVSLQEEALLDAYNDRYYREYNSVAEFAESQVGSDMQAKIKSEQNNFVDSLKRAGYSLTLVNSYNTIINAVAIEIPYASMKSIEGTKGVKSVIMSETYNRPQEAKGEGYNAVENVVDIYETGIYKSDCVDFKGRGTSVAILDSGFDLAHSVFSLDNIENIPEDQLMIKAQDVKDILAYTQAATFTTDLEFSDVYYSTKIPFSYDYADKDPDVNPYDSEHGTHVAGIIAGKDDVITGIAIETQLVLLKVFPDLDDGGKTEDITAALEDAVLLGVDAINMSLGSSCGFAREEDGNAINDIYDKIKKAGISLITAASNSYSSGYGGEQGNTNMVTNPDSATVGSPSTYEAALSVASISGTKSKYIVANGSDVVFFNESNAVTGDPNDFFKELFEDLNATGEQKVTLKYVTVPGVGKAINYNGIDVKGKIALVRRGDNTFEEKALNAKSAGAIACIIYNNIDGDILMSMGKTDHIPTISISKDDGSKLAEKSEGTMVIDIVNQAGPFMSDFSSWGPLPSLELKPEITAHGGNIKSSVPGGGYDELSGTSMATPNLCGIVILIRQYLKEKYPDITAPELSKLTNQMLMSTATIVLNQEGNPYSPRKQGAGLASIANVVNTKAYLSVDGIDRPKLDLLDDPTRSGVYTMKFNVHNIDSSLSVVYDIDLIGMTESVSAYEKTHVAEKATILSDNFTISVENGELNGNQLTVKAGQTAKLTIVYTLSDDDKSMMDELFPYGMYVEGFVKLIDKSEQNGVDLNIPFLAFYGDWTQAPMFDKTYYEVESEAHDQAIDDEDKIKADYYATTPYGSYFYNYIIPLGTYLYDVDTSKYDEIPATEEHIAISNVLGTIDGISAVYAGLLRNAKTMTYSIVDTVTGEVAYEEVFYNARKAYSYGGTPVPNYEYLKLKSTELGLINNRTYTFSMVGRLDYGDGGEANNVRSEFTFDFTFDDEAPVIKSATYEKVYDKTLKKDRYYINLVVYDNHYVQSINPIIFTSSSSYTFLTENPIPVYSEKGANNKVRFEITDYLSDLYADAIITSGLAFSIDDYALNSNIYICQLPGTKGEFKFTSDGTIDGSDLIILTVNEGELVDLTKYLATKDESVDDNKDYLKYLVWTSSNEKVIEVKEGILKANKAGRATVTVKEQMNLNQAILIINVKSNEEELAEASDAVIGNAEDGKIKEIRFSYFDTLFAYSRAAQTSEIGQTGDRKFISAMNGITFYPGEKIKLFYDLEPWYVADKYNVSYESTNPLVASVNEDGEVTGLKEGTTSIVLRVEGSSLMARVRIVIKNEFVIENRSLIAYKGLGGDVVIPDDEGILYIGAYAFCLYTTDNTIELTEEDYDANKIPSMNTSVTSVVIPDGVEDIQKYAFYNCSGLRSVVIPDTVKFIRECAFYNDVKLESIDIKNVQTIGREAFKGCVKLDNVDLSKVYAIGAKAFDGCSSLSKADLSSLRNSGDTAFRHCTNLKELIINEHTKLAQAMFVDIGVEEVTIYNKDTFIPAFLFANCLNLKKVTLKNDLEGIQNGAFSGCEGLTDFVIEGSLKTIGEQAFYNDTSLASFTLPDCDVSIDVYAFYKCEGLKELVFQENTSLISTNGAMFQDTDLTTFTVSANNNLYSSSSNGLLLSKDGKKVILASVSHPFGDLVLDSSIENIGNGAFSGANITSLTITNSNMVIGDYAFANCVGLTKITFPTKKGVQLGMHSFNGTESLVEVENADKVTVMGDYAFANSAIKNITLGDDATFGEGAFFQSSLESVTIGANSKFGMGAFQKCASLVTVNMPEQGGVKFGQSCFGNDSNLKNIDLTKIGAVIASETFYGCSSLYEANIPHVTRIGSYAFADCSKLSKVVLENVQVIGEGAFGRYEQYSQAPRIESINLPDTLTSMGDGAFIGCSALKSVVVPDSVVDFGDFMFTYCESLTSAKLGKGIKNLGEYTFYGCSLLSSVEFSAKEIGELAFSQTQSLETVDLTNVEKIGFGAFETSGLTGYVVADNLVEVGDYAFQNADIMSFSGAKLANIGISAFHNNAKLASFTFSVDLASIGTEAFLGCKALKSFYTPDNKASGTINDFAYLNDGVLYTKMKSGYMQLTSVPAGRDAQTLIVDEGTYRIDRYAGNENEYIKVITLPDSLKLIGNYAFYGYSKLNTVEFKSVTAPALEDYYNSNSELAETDPGFDLLHHSFDLFGFELYYYNFIDLVGKKEPISMVLPSNQDITGYDSLVYEGYFGSIDKAMRSNYVAMEKNMINFISYAKKVQELNVISLTSESLINNAVACYKALTQNPESYGIDLELWTGYVKSVNDAKATLTKLKIEDAGQKVIAVQERIDSLPTEFRVEDLELLSSVASDINALLPKDRALLDTSRYDLLIASYDSYRESVVQEVRPITNSFDNIVAGIAVLTSLLAIGLAFALKAI